MAEFEVLLLVRLLEIVTLAVGAGVIYLAYRGYIRSKVSSMLFLALGFALVTLGSLAEGILYEFFGVPLLEAHATRAALTAFGFLSILYSIYAAK